ncbi:CSC1-like protein At3g54510 isoform X3 [Malania oleifera]|uniref:CSC1-like protein At3g54510 isoform X3 n=1 Tax=Malania oleifera TaxID=397392 RepID=UPI0025AEBAE8|nr:CSC1-like protein At3g54510 isoform X3 [Malania oleifera]
MKTESLLASAAINIGMSMVILSLFSILKKQPSTAPIYYARLLSHRLRLPPFQPPSLLRFLPSVSWIPRAFRVSEDEIIATSGLDALVIIRLFKFGINFFTVCSAVGLLVLLPVNYLEGAPASSSSNCMDSFTISNISRGSNRLWVHYSCLCFISLYALYLLYKEYSEILEKRIQQLRNCRHQPDQFAILVREIPFCVEHQAQGCSVDHFFSKHHPYSYQSYQILYEGNYIENLLELPVAFVTFNSRWGTALAAQSQQHSNPLLFITEMAPEPRDVIWRNLEIPYRHLPLYKIAVFLATLILTVFFAIPVTAVQGIAKFEKLRKWFPPAMAVQLIPGLRSIVTGYLPSVILNGFIYTIPFAMLALSNLAGCISTSNRDIKACNMVFYFLMGNVFFLSLLSGSLLEEIGESVSHPRNIPSHLARAVSAQADFFMTYILADGLSGFSLEVLQPTLLLWDLIKTYTYGYGKKKNPYLYMLPYFRVIPFVSLSILIGMIYAVVSPLLLPFLVGYFFLGYAVYVNQIQDVYETVYETCGQYWPCIHHYILIAIILMQITMIGLFGLKSKPAASISTVPLLLFTLMFNEYCKIRFLPTFSQYSIQKAVENDELDKKGGLMEINYENALNAYRPPCLTPVNLLASESSSESSSTQPLVSSL